ncbi:nitrilotriacetate monooxygenase component b [Stagonosporopsis vannaccii]|nr:nitrilotriacetate monooxygenase component b [Stagonosporopsis vannaccii]
MFSRLNVTSQHSLLRPLTRQYVCPCQFATPFLTKSSLKPHPSTAVSTPSTCRKVQSTAAQITSATEGHYKIIDRVTDFEQKQSSRPDFDPLTPISLTKSPNPTWTYGAGAAQDPAARSANHIEVDPYAPDRPMINNYKLLISGIAPRPIGFLSTVSKDGQKNLAPFSYFQVVDHDPPMFIVGFSSRPGRAKDTFVNLKQTGECVINTVSENMIEAVNASSIDAPFGTSEWDLSGLTEAESSTVQPSRVRESVFSIEGRVVDIKEFRDDEKEGLSVAANVLIKASRFWVREDATNAEVSHIELDKLRPVAQLGGMAYGRVTETFEVPRRRWVDEVRTSDTLQDLEQKSLERDVVEETDVVEERAKA